MHISRPSLSQWVQSTPQMPYIIPSTAMPGRSLRVWRTDGHDGFIPRSDWHIITRTQWAAGQVHHIRNYHGRGEGYTRYDVELVPLVLHGDSRCP